MKQEMAWKTKGTFVEYVRSQKRGDQEELLNVKEPENKNTFKSV